MFFKFAYLESIMSIMVTQENAGEKTMSSIFNNDNNQRIFQKGILTVVDNLLSTPSSAIQISNVSQVYVDRLPQESYRLSIIAGLIGVALIAMGRTALAVGFVFLVTAAFLAFLSYSKNSNNKYGLFIDLNSGSRLIFPSGNIDFLLEAANMLANVMKSHGVIEKTIINITDNSIKNAKGIIVSGGNSGEIITALDEN